MRDIRPDLQERLDSLLHEQELHQKRLAELETQKKLIASLFQAEEQRWGGRIAPVHKPQDLIEIICDVMSDGGEWYGASVADVLLKRGYDFGAGKPGRITHFTLLGMRRRDLVESVGEGKWKLKPQQVKHDAA